MIHHHKITYVWRLNLTTQYSHQNIDIIISFRKKFKNSKPRFVTSSFSYFYQTILIIITHSHEPRLKDLPLFQYVFSM